MRTTCISLLVTSLPPFLTAHPTSFLIRQADALCPTRCLTISTTFSLIATHIAAETYIPHNLLSDLATQQAGILAAGCDYNTCMISPIHPRVEDGFRPNDRREEARELGCEELRGRVLGAFRGEFGRSIREWGYVCTQSLMDVMVWQEEMGRKGEVGCGGLGGTDEGMGSDEHGEM